jgi:hypothetical protein
MDEAHDRTTEYEPQMVDESTLALTKDSYIDTRTESDSSEPESSLLDEFAVTLITESDMDMTESDSSSSQPQSSSLLSSIDDQNFADLLKRVDSSTGLTALRMRDGLYRRNSSVEDFLSLAASGDIPHQDPALLQVPLMQHQQAKNERNINYFLSLASAGDIPPHQDPALLKVP